MERAYNLYSDIKDAQNVGARINDDIVGKVGLQRALFPKL